MLTREMRGSEVVLQPLGQAHAIGLCEASSHDPTLYQWSPVPQGIEAVTAYIENALELQAKGTAAPFAIIRRKDEAVLGSTRFWNIERWQWPPEHSRFGRSAPDVCEIGYTWLSSKAIRTAANTESKFLMLQHAFEIWRVLRVCFHTDRRNQRSQTALERIGGQKEGLLRCHRLAADFTARDSIRYSIIAEEWPNVKAALLSRLTSTFTPDEAV